MCYGSIKVAASPDPDQSKIMILTNRVKQIYQRSILQIYKDTF